MIQRFHKHGKRVLVVLLGTVLVLFGFVWLKSGSYPEAAARRAWSRVRYATIRPASGDTILPIAFDRQDHSLSCEVATLKMALSYRGVRVTESDLIMLVGVDRTPKYSEGEQPVWGDPDIAFVGNIDGRMFRDGYGVYEGPIARAGSTYRRTFAFRGWSVQQLAAQLVSGNPVIIWGYLGSGAPVSWVTPEGHTVNAVSYEHTFLVYGIRGTTSHPEGFYVIDPIYGPKYMDVTTLETMWSALGQRGVIVY